MKKPLFLFKIAGKTSWRPLLRPRLEYSKSKRRVKKARFLSYDQLKALSWAEDLPAYLPLIRIRSIDRRTQDKRPSPTGLGSRRPSPRSGNHRLGQRESFSSHLANDFDALVKAIEKGALINANDRFGHTPLHFTAYKGNARFLQYLLRNGGDPNARGRHDSTPSAAWEEAPRPWKSQKVRMSTPEPTKRKPPA